MDAVAQQIASEEAADAAAEVAAIKQLDEYLAAGNIDRLPRAKLLLGNVFPHVLEHIEKEQQRRGAGPGAHLRTWLRSIPADVAAVMAIRTCMRIILVGAGRSDAGATMQRISMGVAREWVQEVQVRQAEQVNPAYYGAAMRGLEQANVSSKKHISMTVNRVIRNTLDGLYENTLTDTDLLHLGKHGLQACMNAGLVEVDRSTNRNGHLVLYRLPEAVMAFLGDPAHAIRMAKGGCAPMRVPPVPWNNLVGGGYCTERRQLQYPLLNYRRTVRKGHSKAFIKATSIDQMPQVYQYVNYLQSEPFAINADVYAVVADVWGKGGNALGMPSTKAPAKPPFPLPEGWEKEKATEQELAVFGDWKRRTTRWHEATRAHSSLVWEMYHFVKHAREHAGGPLYYPVFLDSRGRLYYRASPNPQGSDAAKAVLQFHNKKPLGKRGAFWLKVHIANCFGVDRPRFAQRAKWTEEHWERLRGSLSDPAASGVYEEADSPLCALAGVMELAKAIASGNPETFLSGLPVHMDATCSGLQHFSAMLRDEVGGKYVNLTPGGDEKADIYRRVADLIREQIVRDASTGCPLAAEWSRLEVTRNLAKSPVMTYVYGATLVSVAEGVMTYLDELGYKPVGVTVGKMAYYMGKKMFAAVEATVPAAAAAMRYLRELMRHVDRNKPVLFHTALGLPVLHDYQDVERTRVRVRSCDMEYVVLYKRLERTNSRSMQDAISPNVVHSLDGTHLGMTALRMQAGGRSMVTVHDSFGTHACDVDAMHRDIRSAFVALYSRDHLDDLANQLGVDVTYTGGTGKLDLTQVLDSEFFFC